MKANRTYILTGIVVIAAVVAYVGLSGKYPPVKGTEGAIGAAHRYQAGQITDQDVVLKSPEVQSFLQSDLFHKLATDADFRNCVSRDGFRKVAVFLASRTGDGIRLDAAHQIDAAKTQIDNAVLAVESARNRGDAVKVSADELRTLDGLKQSLDQAKVQLDAARTDADAAHLVEAAIQTMDAAVAKMEGLRGLNADAAAVRSLDEARTDIQNALHTTDGLTATLDAARGANVDAAHQTTDGVRVTDNSVAMITDGIRDFADNAVARDMPAEQLQVMFSSEFAHLMQNASYRDLLADGAFRAEAAKGNLDGLQGKLATEWAAFKTNPDQVALLHTADWKNLVGSQGFATIMNDFAHSQTTDGAGRILALVSDSRFGSYAGSDFATLVSDGAVQKLVLTDSFKNMTDSAIFVDALKAPAFDALLTTNADMAKVFNPE